MSFASDFWDLIGGFSIFMGALAIGSKIGGGAKAIDFASKFTKNAGAKLKPPK
jgi:hypothetical protein